MEALRLVPIHRPVRARDPHERGRVATELELLFDLIFVVAIASNAAQLHHGIVAGHWETIVGYLLTWCAIWWAWVNYTWYASAYDNDDLIFRLLTFVVMAGALCLAAAVPDLFADGQSVLAVVGYAIMRFAVVGLWLRAAAGDPGRRPTALRYVAGISFAQILWIARLAVPSSWLLPTFVICVGIEWLVPAWAERVGRTSYHPHHIAERYGLLTIIVLGEVILSSVMAVQGVLGSHVGVRLLPLVAGGLVMVFSLWWLYFKRENHDLVAHPRSVWVFAYGHYFVFAAVSAIGSGIAAAVDIVEGGEEVVATDLQVGLFIGALLAVFSVALMGMHVIHDRGEAQYAVPALLVSLGVVALPFAGWSIGWTVLAQALVMAAGVAQHLAKSQRLITPD